ncbi:MAG: hypothetical protein WD423_00385 [Rhodothermales bacterium]
MDRELIKDYLGRSGMNAAQSETLSHILADMESRLATKQDVVEMKADLTWRMVAIVTLFGTIISIVNGLII